MSNIIQIRCSAIPSYGDCPRRAASQLFKEKLRSDGFILNSSRPSAAAGIGTAIHKGIAELLKAKQATGEFVASEVALAAERAISSFQDETKEGVIWDKTTPHSETAYIQIRSLLYSFVPLLDRLQPTHIELPLSKTISPLGEQAAVKIELTGTLDVRDTLKVIHDHKTGHSMPSPQAQLGGYIALCRLNDIEVDGAVFNYAKREGIRKCQTGLEAPLQVRLDPEECLNAFWAICKQMQRDYEDYLMSVDSGNPDPWTFLPNPMSQMCTPKYCSAHTDSNWCTMGKGCNAEE